MTISELNINSHTKLDHYRYGFERKLNYFAALVASVALAILGITATAALSPFIGIPIIIISLPISYIAYNGYQFNRNLLDILTNPSSVITWFGKFDVTKVRENLAKNTILFEPFIDHCMLELFTENPDFI